MEVLSVIILFLSGIGAGVITGMIGASAVTFMAPILISLLGYSAYTAIGISLLTDVSASLMSAHIYRRVKNIDLRRALIIGIIATIFAFIGSVASRHIPDFTLGGGLGIIILITGISFYRNPLKRKDRKLIEYFRNRKTFGSIVIGIFVGLFGGIFGVGGGITILIALVFILKYPIKMAIGTSVLIMAFIAFAGGAGHFIDQPLPIMAIIITSLGAVTGAFFASKYANKTSEEKMFKISGVILILISIFVLFEKFLRGIAAGMF